MKLPFEWLPASWGLRGKTRKIAKAEYELEPDSEELARKLLDINFDIDQLSPEDEYPEEYRLRSLDLDLKFQKITLSEYDRKKADIIKVPYVAVKESGFDYLDGPGGFWMEFEWNRDFIEFLETHGYSAPTEKETFDAWLADIYRSQILSNELSIEDETEATDVSEESEEELRIISKRLENGKVSYE